MIGASLCGAEEEDSRIGLLPGSPCVRSAADASGAGAAVDSVTASSIGKAGTCKPEAKAGAGVKAMPRCGRKFDCDWLAMRFR